ncbi:hypothetical protein FHR81_004558 [Actinoalloteichus hoggarensis]|uniref:MFS transporter n=1 Tax=Actinoalloteichus hoggarensis TaxID=1470176 RepID=UPI0012FE2DC5|nr:MFS transporter [Actinoalloteichus hoggarensis]MBB5923487.1 hypothetical protein [Actinoalloteichus hoggarensis]
MPTLSAVFVGAFVALLAATTVNVALPDIGSAFSVGEETSAWTLSGCFLSFGTILISAGRLDDRHGHRMMSAVALSLCTPAILAGGLSGDPVRLVVLRVVQGLGAGLFFPIIDEGLRMLLDVVVGAPRGRDGSGVGPAMTSGSLGHPVVRTPPGADRTRAAPWRRAASRRPPAEPRARGAAAARRSATSCEGTVTRSPQRDAAFHIPGDPSGGG